MPTFSYTARTANGELKNDTMEASNRDDVITQLRKQRLTVVKIDEGAAKKKRMGTITMRDIVIFTRQFSTMINSGLPLVQALDILAQQSENPALRGRDAAGGVRRRVGPHGGRRAAQASEGVHGAVREHGGGR